MTTIEIVPVDTQVEVQPIARADAYTLVMLLGMGDDDDGRYALAARLTLDDLDLWAERIAAFARRNAIASWDDNPYTLPDPRARAMYDGSFAVDWWREAILIDMDEIADDAFPTIDGIPLRDTFDTGEGEIIHAIVAGVELLDGETADGCRFVIDDGGIYQIVDSTSVWWEHTGHTYNGRNPRTTQTDFSLDALNQLREQLFPAAPARDVFAAWEDGDVTDTQALNALYAQWLVATAERERVQADIDALRDHLSRIVERTGTVEIGTHSLKNTAATPTTTWKNDILGPIYARYLVEQPEIAAEIGAALSHGARAGGLRIDPIKQPRPMSMSVPPPH